MYKWMLGVCALGLLSGCGAFEARAPRPFTPHTEEKDGILISESTFQSADEWVHFERSWRPKADARGMLVVVHGLKDHSARYADFAMGLAKRGFSVRSYDHRGHGRPRLAKQSDLDAHSFAAAKKLAKSSDVEAEILHPSIDYPA